MAGARIQTMEEFWAYYLGEHRKPLCRILHFVGTSIFFASVGISLWVDPVWFGAALGAIIALGLAGAWMERWRNAALPLLAMIAVGVVAQPQIMGGGILLAYFLAWIGHFGVEHNRPATFAYPAWSFLCDLRMWGLMARGRIWTGDPVEVLGLTPPEPA
jgi:hypothetical protein